MSIPLIQERGSDMPDCPFLSTFDNDVECYKECPLYNYKENGGMCPFTSLGQENTNEYLDYENLENVGENIDYY